MAEATEWVPYRRHVPIFTPVVEQHRTLLGGHQVSFGFSLAPTHHRPDALGTFLASQKHRLF